MHANKQYKAIFPVLPWNIGRCLPRHKSGGNSGNAQLDAEGLIGIEQ